MPAAGDGSPELLPNHVLCFAFPSLTCDSEKDYRGYAAMRGAGWRLRWFGEFARAQDPFELEAKQRHHGIAQRLNTSGLRGLPDRRQVDLVERLEPSQAESDPPRVDPHHVGDGADDVGNQLVCVPLTLDDRPQYDGRVFNAARSDRPLDDVAATGRSGRGVGPRCSERK
jgi:hypothetical protein